MDIGSLFTQAARHAAKFREARSNGMQRAENDYAAEIALFSADLPKSGLPAEQVLEELVTKASPGLQLMVGPRFFAWVVGGSHPMGVAADFLTSAWGQNAGNHVAAPAAAAAELVAGQWLLELLDLPREASVGFVTGATMANFTCLAAARSAVLRARGWDADAMGLFSAPPISVLIGDDAHATVFSALQFLGLGHDRVVRIPTDRQGRIVPEAFENACAGIHGPAIAILQAGQINTGGFDNFRRLIPAARRCGAWVHVDGAFGLWANTVEAKRHLRAGVGEADSWASDGHKWLQTPYDCGYAIVRDADSHHRAMTIAASYLPMAEQGERDPSHYVPELSRRARGFATWAMIRHLGRDGISAMIDRNCRAAALLADRVSAVPGIAVLNDVVLNQAIVRFGSDSEPEEADRMTDSVIALLRERGEIFVGGAVWRGRKVMRFSVSNFQTDEKQASWAADAIIRAFHDVEGR